MPAALPVLALGAIGFATGAVVFTGVTLFGTLFTAGLVGAMGSMAQRRAKSSLERAQRDNNRINVLSSVEPIPVICGTVKKCSGAYAFIRTSRLLEGFGPIGDFTGKDEQRLNIVLVWGEGEVSAITELYIGDKPISDPSFQILKYSLPLSPPAVQNLGYLVYSQSYLGSDTQLADPTLLAVVDFEDDFTDRWTADHRLLGCAYSFITMIFDVSLFGSGEPIITADIDGKRIPHPTTGLPTVLGNPAWILWDYLTNTRYGCGFAVAELDLLSFQSAADYCDEWVVPEGTEGARRRYSCNGILSADDSKFDNVAAILASMRALPIDSGTSYGVQIDRPEAQTFQFSEDNIIGELSIALDAGDQRFNRARVRFINDAKDGNPDFVIVDNPTYRAADGGMLLQMDIELRLVTSAAIARDIGEMELRRSRYGAVVSLMTTINGLRCKVGDVVGLTHASLGWTSQSFRVRAMSIKTERTIAVTLLEYNDDVHDITHASQDLPLGSSLPNPLEAPDVTVPANFLTVTAPGTILVQWNSMADYNLLELEIQYAVAATDPEWTSLTIGDPTLTTHEITGLQAVNYFVRIRAVTLLGIRGAWTSGEVTSTGVSAGGDRVRILKTTLPIPIGNLGGGVSVVVTFISGNTILVGADLNVECAAIFDIDNETTVSAPTRGLEPVLIYLKLYNDGLLVSPATPIFEVGRNSRFRGVINFQLNQDAAEVGAGPYNFAMTTQWTCAGATAPVVTLMSPTILKIREYRPE